MERVRLRVCKMIHRPTSPVPEARTARQDEGPKVDAASVSGDLDTIVQVLNKCDVLVAQAWSVAVSLNAVRRRCRTCEETDLLSEAIGVHQGVLNELQHNLRTVARAIANIRGRTARAGGEAA